MQVLGGGFQIPVPEQNLDSAQIGAGLQQMGRPTVAERMRGDSFADASPTRGLATCNPDRLVRNGRSEERRVGRLLDLGSGVSRRRHTRCYRDWSSDVCSSDLRYWAVVSRSPCPSRTWIVRRSVPASNKWVAQLWRSVCGVTRLRMPARRAALLHAIQTVLSEMGDRKSVV